MQDPLKHLYDPLVPESDPVFSEEDLTSPKKTVQFQERGAAVEGGGRRKPRLNRYALGGAILASTNSILLGYDIGVMSGAVLFIRESLMITPTQVEILVGSLNVVSLFGSLASGRTSDWIGRRYTIVLAASTFLIGALLMGLAPSFMFLMAGRVVAGVGVGYALMIAPVYAAEISPVMTRGFLSSLPEVFINVGILLGYVSNYALSGLPVDISWRLMLGLAGVPAIAIGAGVMTMPESPRWLVMEGRFEEAKRVLIKTSEDEVEAELRLNQMKTNIGVDGSTGLVSARSHGQGVWKELLWRPARPVRRILIAAIGLNFLMQASGNDAVVYFSPEVFQEAGISDNQQLLGSLICLFVYVLISLDQLLSSGYIAPKRRPSARPLVSLSRGLRSMQTTRERQQGARLVVAVA
ncbi:hypothetical protein NL676_033369 [Syzygium grande]|nr:hypothetical protein NL676_033369 [Syzygium grande]